MASADTLSDVELVRLLRRALDVAPWVEIDGLGRFEKLDDGAIRFVAQESPRVFIGFVEEDRESAERLADDLVGRGYDPWIDRRKLLPGQNWLRAIEAAIETSDFFVACFSQQSIVKKGTFQAEIRYALDCARRVPLDDAFFLPVRLDSCAVPRRIRREVQYIDLFPDWDQGMCILCAIIDRQLRRNSRYSK